MANPLNARQLDVVVWGASGFTGRLVAEHLVRDYHGKGVRWAMAGRNKQKLEQIRSDLSKTYGKPDIVTEVEILTADLNDPASLDAVASKTNVIISTAGPFAQIGTPVVDAAVRSSTHYVDITGEVPWVRSMVAKHHAEAASKGVRIVPCCGYDAIPSDLGTLMVVNELKKQGKDAEKVVTVIMDANGGFSGGTIASGMNMVANPIPDPDMKDAGSVYALLPKGAPRGDDKEFWGTEYINEVQKWVGPFIMQVCNNRVVHRSAYFNNYGPDFHYQESFAAKSWMAAKGIGLALGASWLAMGQTWLHPLIKKVVPKQGEGPSREIMMEKGFWRHNSIAYSRKTGDEPQTVVIGEVEDKHRDPGYWGTSRMVLEAALCLALDKERLDKDEALVKGGVLTAATAMGEHLIERMRAAGITYRILETKTVA